MPKYPLFLPCHLFALTSRRLNNRQMEETLGRSQLKSRIRIRRWWILPVRHAVSAPCEMRCAGLVQTLPRLRRLARLGTCMSLLMPVSVQTMISCEAGEVESENDRFHERFVEQAYSPFCAFVAQTNDVH